MPWESSVGASVGGALDWTRVWTAGAFSTIASAVREVGPTRLGGRYTGACRHVAALYA